MPTQQKAPMHKGRRTRKPVISPERQLAALVLWGIALIVLISIPLGKVPIISLIPSLLKGLFGLGYYFVPVTLFAAGYFLLSTPKGPGLLQSFLCGLIPIPIGSIHHAIFCTAATQASSESSLWETGTALQSGGIVSGGAAQGLVSILGVPVTAALSGILLAVLVGITLLPILLKRKETEKKRSETYYSRPAPRTTASYRPEPERHTSRHTQGKRVRPSAYSKISEYNIQMDGDVSSEPAKSSAVSGDSEGVVSNSFYRPKSHTVRTPVDNILRTLEDDSVQEIPELDITEQELQEPESDKNHFKEAPPFKPHTFTKRTDSWVPWVPLIWTTFDNSSPKSPEKSHADKSTGTESNPEKVQEDIQDALASPSLETEDISGKNDAEDMSAPTSLDIEDASGKSGIEDIPVPTLSEIEDISGENNTEIFTSFILIGYQKPLKPNCPQKETAKDTEIIQALPPTFQPAFLPEHQSGCSTKYLPPPAKTLALPPAPSFPRLPQPPVRLALPEKEIPFTADGRKIHDIRIADKENIFTDILVLPDNRSFILVDYLPPKKRIYPIRFLEALPSSCPIFVSLSLLPPAPLRSLFPASSFVLVDYQEPEVPQKGLRELLHEEFKANYKETLSDASPARKLLLLPERSIICSIVNCSPLHPIDVPAWMLSAASFILVDYQEPELPKILRIKHPESPLRLPQKKQILLLPAHDEDYITEPHSSCPPVFLSTTLKQLLPRSSFILFGYQKPEIIREVVGNLRRVLPEDDLTAQYERPLLALPPVQKPLLLSGRTVASSRKTLPPPAAILFLPPVPSYPLLPQSPDRLLLPAPKSLVVMDALRDVGEIDLSVGTEMIEATIMSEETAFVLINYHPPKKRRYIPAKKTLLLPERKILLLLAACGYAESVDVSAEEQTESIESVVSLPSITLLNAPQNQKSFDEEADLRSNAEHLSDVLRSFGVKVTCGDVVQGPTITQYEFTLDRGVKLSKITNLADDIALALGASGVRIAPIPGKISIVGIEVPNKHIAPVCIQEVIQSPEFQDHKSKVAFAVGKDIGNRSVVGDIAELPHVLIAGTTGSGKSVCTNSLIISILYKATPEDARFIMIDPKMVELAPYNGIPHLLVPVVTDPKKAAGALQWAVYEMMKRYKRFAELGVKKLAEYNALAERDAGIEHMSTIVIVIDELADLMLVAAKEVEESICRVAQMGRAAGMHLVIATQRPSSDVITGLMKANIPSRIAFAVASSLESRIILDQSGAEKLVGRGDMLYAPLGTGKPQRVQGCYITPEEIDRVVTYVKSTGEAQYSDEVMEKIEESAKEKESKNASASIPAEDMPDSADEQLLREAVGIFLDCGQASVSMLQRRLKLGYSRAARLVDEMEERGYVGAFEGSKPRKMLITREEWDEICSDAGMEDDEY